MSNLRRFFLVLLCVASLALVAAWPVVADTAILGEHSVKAGETLYCIGRGYSVYPPAIAEANGLRRDARLTPGQVLKIPATVWANIPPGPVCAPQFGVALPTPTPTATTLPDNASGSKYTVQRGDNLYRIGRLFGVTVAAIQNANGLGKRIIIYPGQILWIPGVECESSYPGICIPQGLPDLDCGQIPYRDFAVVPPDPHGFDGDRDGIGCETSIEPPPPTGCPSGCITPPPGCYIKGNISIETGEKIYHVPGGQFYDSTIIRPQFGERWFCTEIEAIQNGWRKSER